MSLLPHLHRLPSRVILASASPRRRELLSSLLSPLPALVKGINLEIIPSTFAENLSKDGKTAAAYARLTASAKGKEVFDRCCGEKDKAVLVISADTVVESPAGDVLEKPSNKQHATSMMQQLSGEWHAVHTGVCLMLQSSSGNMIETTFSTTTKVRFAQLSPEVIDAYTDTVEPYDKAGGYGIQTAGLGGSLVEEIEGCYFNVVGFPIRSFVQALIELLDKVKDKDDS